MGRAEERLPTDRNQSAPLGSTPSGLVVRCGPDLPGILRSRRAADAILPSPRGEPEMGGGGRFPAGCFSVAVEEGPGNFPIIQAGAGEAQLRDLVLAGSAAVAGLHAFSVFPFAGFHE